MNLSTDDGVTDPDKANRLALFQLRKDIVEFADDLGHIELIEAVKANDDTQMIRALTGTKYPNPVCVLGAGKLSARYKRLERLMGAEMVRQFDLASLAEEFDPSGSARALAIILS